MGVVEQMWECAEGVTCSRKTDPPVMRVIQPLVGTETLDEFDSQEAAYARADHRQAA